MKKKVVAAMLVTCMAVSLTACGNSDTSQKTDKTTAKTKRLLTILKRTKQIPRNSDSKKKKQNYFGKRCF